MCNDGGIYAHLILVKYSHFLTPIADRKQKLLITKDVLKIILKLSALLPELLLILMSLQALSHLVLSCTVCITTHPIGQKRFIILYDPNHFPLGGLCYTQPTHRIAPTLLIGKEIKHLQSLYGDRCRVNTWTKCS